MRLSFCRNGCSTKGYETVMATRGQQALALAEEIRPDLILLDVMMPGMDGIETCRRLRMNPATADIPVILVSARSPSEARAEGSAGRGDRLCHQADPFCRSAGTDPTNCCLQEDVPPDHLRLLEEMAYTTLTVLPCNLAWLLIVDSDKRWLVHQVVAMERGVERPSIIFWRWCKSDQPEIRFRSSRGDNPAGRSRA